MHALIIGATGATGKDLLQLLLQQPWVQAVSIFVRKPEAKTHPKLTVHVINFGQPDEWKELVKGDLCFSCLGTTLKDAGSKRAQWQVDYEYQYQFALAAKSNGIKRFLLISSTNASSRSMFFYAKMKGALEDAVKQLGFESLAIFQPPILVRKNTRRTGEKIGLRILRFANKLGLLKRQTPLPTDVLAKAMVKYARNNVAGVTVLQNEAIRAQALLS